MPRPCSLKTAPRCRWSRRRTRVTTELLTAPVLLGKQIFYNAADPRMSADSYISCASLPCRWRARRPRVGFHRSRRRPAPHHRSARSQRHGAWQRSIGREISMKSRTSSTTSAAPSAGPVFLASHPSSSPLNILPPRVEKPASAPISTRSRPMSPRSRPATRRAVHRAIRTARSPPPPCAGRRYSKRRTAPRATAETHSPTARSSNVGTLSTLSGSRLGQPLTGIDTPTLHGLHATRVYLHHGQAETLGDVFSYAGGTLLPGSCRAISNHRESERRGSLQRRPRTRRRRILSGSLRRKFGIYR